MFAFFKTEVVLVTFSFSQEFSVEIAYAFNIEVLLFAGHFSIFQNLVISRGVIRPCGVACTAAFSVILYVDSHGESVDDLAIRAFQIDTDVILPFERRCRGIFGDYNGFRPLIERDESGRSTCVDRQREWNAFVDSLIIGNHEAPRLSHFEIKGSLNSV